VWEEVNHMKRIRKLNPPRPPKPPERPQNPISPRALGKTKWIKAHWRWDYTTHQWNWILGHWSK
jgi:hypothetical protein